MENRIIIPLLCAAALAYACGPWTHSDSSHEQSAHASTSTSGTSAVAQFPHKKTHNVDTTFAVSPNGGRVDFALRVTNNTRKTVELKFPSGQTHDFVVLDALGRTVWRWSTGKLFTQTMQSKTVKSSDTLTIEDGWDASNAHGQYVAVATLNTDTHPVERRVAFTLP